jgi:hypothetical protein
LIVSQKENSNRPVDSSAQPDLQILNCHVKLTKACSAEAAPDSIRGSAAKAGQEKDNAAFDAFAIEICGSIHVPNALMHTDTTLKISIMDITDAKPVYSRIQEWQMQNSPVFCYTTNLGKLPNQVTTLLNWTPVAQLHLDWLMFPHKGTRNLQFNAAIFSRQTSQELACAACTFTYDNPEFGYVDLQENIQRTKILTVALAFAVSAIDKKLYNCEIELIKNWARDNIDAAGVSDRAKHNLDKALNKTIAFFRSGSHLDTYKICKEIIQIAPLAARYDILELCLYVAQAKGFVTAEEITLLKDLANWLDVDRDRFREMTERILPVNMHKVKDVEVILGVTPDMSQENTRQKLNKLFCKWNSRVTNSNPAIQDQADQMLKLIAETRNQYIG